MGSCSPPTISFRRDDSVEKNHGLRLRNTKEMEANNHVRSQPGMTAPPQKFRRHSLQHTRRISDMLEDDGVLLLKVDLFLSELERRLDYLEKEGRVKIDAGVERAYATLQAVRESCGRMSDEIIGEGKRRAQYLVEILEQSYHEVLEARETLPAKVAAGLQFLEETLSDFEARSHASVDRQKDRARRGMEAMVRAKDQLADSIETAIRAAKERRLITYDELPVPWRVNPYIVKGYRFSEKKIDCIRSAFQISNEAVNIWSHFLGLLLVIAIGLCFYPSTKNFALSSGADKVINALFFISAAKALACSTIWHTMSSIAELDLMERFACIDYSGISLLVASSILTTEYTAFYCELWSRNVYMSITLGLGIVGAIFPWHPVFNKADMRIWRVAFYVSLAATGAIPFMQLVLQRGFAWTWWFYVPIIKSLAVYSTGAAIYAALIPERWFPGVFDWVGGSHNIWHACVLGGILFHFQAMQQFFEVALARQCPA